MIKWILLLILTMATIIVQLFLFWIIDEKAILNINKDLMASELKKIEKLELLDTQVQEVFINTSMKVSNERFARKKLLKFFDKNKKSYNFSIKKYFNNKNGMLNLELTAVLHDTKKLKSFFRLFDSSVLIKLTSLQQHNKEIKIDFKVFYPFKEYL